MGIRAGLLASALLVAAAGCNTKKSDDGNRPPRGSEPPTQKVDARWEQVVAWAKPTVEPGDPARFTRAVELARDHTKAVRGAHRRAERYAVDAGVLPAAVDEAVAALVGWAQAGDGLAVAVCDDPGQTVAQELLVAYELARAALLTAPDDPEHPHVMAVLYLGHRLRGEGKNALQVTVGMAVSAAAVDWAQARGVKPGKTFRDLAPTRDDGFRALAAEAVCQVSLVEVGGRQDQAIGTQLAAVRAFNTDTVHGAFRRKGDPKRLEAYLVARAEQGRKQTETPVLRRLASATRLLVDIRKERDAYERAVAP